MSRLVKHALLVTALGALSAHAVAQSVPVIGLVELSGAGATAGTNFNNGVKLAVKEINAQGGLGGRPIEYSANDTQTNPGTAKALAAMSASLECTRGTQAPTRSALVSMRTASSPTPRSVAPQSNSPPLGAPTPSSSTVGMRAGRRRSTAVMSPPTTTTLPRR